MSFEKLWSGFPLTSTLARVKATTPEEVERALEADEFGFEHFLKLISPAATPYVEAMAQKAMRITRQRFGRVMQMYAPLYVSSECTNACLYCGFSTANDIRRRTLTVEEALAESEKLWTQGFRNILLVSGEAPKKVPVKYFAELARELSTAFHSIGIEIYPLGIDDYATLEQAGVDSLTLYQETYDTELYRRIHPSGRKSDYAWRLDGPTRAGQAGMRRVGIGSLLGLGSWRLEAVALGLHALWLQENFWRTQVCISFPRLRNAPGGFTPPNPVSDVELVQMACAYRLLLPDAGLVLSTREAAELRDGMAPIAITHMSAGSCTEPGGYSEPGSTDNQFDIVDERSPAEVARALLAAGIEPVWKDWDAAFTLHDEAFAGAGVHPPLRAAK